MAVLLHCIPSSSCPRSFKNVYFLNELDTKRRGYYVQLVYSFFLQGKPTTQYIISNCMQSLSINCCRPFRSLTKFTSSVLKLIVSTSATASVHCNSDSNNSNSDSNNSNSDSNSLVHLFTITITITPCLIHTDFYKGNKTHNDQLLHA